MDPLATPVAKPEALTVATAVFDDVQVAELVRFWVLPSVNVPMAVYCTVPPGATDELAGVTVRETRMGATTLNAVEPDTEPELAVIVAFPSPALVARPADPGLLLMMATEMGLELHVTEPEMS
jgi:hypothetical protein